MPSFNEATKEDAKAMTNHISRGLKAARLIIDEARIIERDPPLHAANKFIDSATGFLSAPPDWVERITPLALTYEVASRAIADVGLASDYCDFYYDEVKEEISEILDEHGESATKWEVMDLASRFSEIVEDQLSVGRRALRYALWSEGFVTPDSKLKREFNEVDSLREYIRGKAMAIHRFEKRYVEVQKGLADTFRERGVLEVGDLTELSAADLRAIDGIGRVTVREIKDGLSRLGLSLK